MTKRHIWYSKYKEISFGHRKEMAEKEFDKWEMEADKYREYRLEWNRTANEDYLPTHPLHVDIELSNVCNLRCKMCIHGIRRMTNVGFMDKDLTLRLIDECAYIGVYSIKFNWRGEVTLNDFLPGAVKYAKNKAILEVQINTNGLPHKKDILIQCAKNQIDRIIFSVDGFSKNTYENIRIGGNYDNLIRNIHRLIEWRKKKKKASYLYEFRWSEHKPMLMKSTISSSTGRFSLMILEPTMLQIGARETVCLLGIRLLLAGAAVPNLFSVSLSPVTV